MSGILGIWNFDGRPVERIELARVSATLAHRGADAEGLLTRGPVGLACRLARITPSVPVEVQPLVGPAGITVLFDGRLDNRDDLLDALRATQPIDAHASDPSFVLAAYRAYGDACPEHLIGDFALAVFDPGRHQLLLARDVIGVRPLYFHATRELCVFASEAKTVLADRRISSGPADDVLADLIFNGLRSEDSRGLSFFRNVLSVPPAHLAIVTPGGVTTRRYWDFDPALQTGCRSVEDHASGFRHYFEQAVRRRLRSARPVAVSVSGGLDSSAIFCDAETMRRAGAAIDAPLLGASYTAPDGSPADEQAFLIEIERQYGVTIPRFAQRSSGVLHGARRGIWHVEAPVLDAEWGSMSAYLAFVRQLGAGVLLTGHWGDQFLANDAHLVDLCRGGAWRTAWTRAGEYGRWLGVSDPNCFRKRLASGVCKHYLPAPLLRALRSVRGAFWRGPNFAPWYAAPFRQLAGRRQARTGSAPRWISAHARSLYGLVRSRYHVLCMESNNKVGAMHGLDMAFPFLDRDLLVFLIATPGEIVSAGGVPKGLLREALHGVLPAAIARRAGKADFTERANDGVAREYDQLAQSLRAPGLVGRRGYVRPDQMAEQLARVKPDVRGDTSTVSGAFVNLVALELWLQTFFEPDASH